MVLYELGILAMSAWACLFLTSAAIGFATQTAFVSNMHVQSATIRAVLIIIKGLAFLMKSVSSGIDLGLNILASRLNQQQIHKTAPMASPDVSAAVHDLIGSVPKRRKMTPA